MVGALCTRQGALFFLLDQRIDNALVNHVTVTDPSIDMTGCCHAVMFVRANVRFAWDVSSYRCVVAEQYDCSVI